MLLLSGQMDERQTDWIAGERELCKTLTGRNRWLNFKGGTGNSQQRVLEIAVMSSCPCQSMKYERDSCIYNFLMLQTKYCGEEEESNDEKRNWEDKWKYLLLSRKGKDWVGRQMGCEVPLMWNLCPHSWGLQGCSKTLLQDFCSSTVGFAGHFPAPHPSSETSV